MGFLIIAIFLSSKALQGAGLGSNAIVSYAPFIFAVAYALSNLFCSWYQLQRSNKGVLLSLSVVVASLASPLCL